MCVCVYVCVCACVSSSSQSSQASFLISAIEGCLSILLVDCVRAVQTHTYNFSLNPPYSNIKHLSLTHTHTHTRTCTHARTHTHTHTRLGTQSPQRENIHTHTNLIIWGLMSSDVRLTYYTLLGAKQNLWEVDDIQIPLVQW